MTSSALAAGARAGYRNGFPVARALAQVRDFLNLCAVLAEPRGVRVAVEPYNQTDANLMNTVPEALAEVRGVDRPSVKLMADFFHMVLNGESLDELEEAGPFLIHAHIAEPGAATRRRPPPTTERFCALCVPPATTVT